MRKIPESNRIRHRLSETTIPQRMASFVHGKKKRDARTDVVSCIQKLAAGTFLGLMRDRRRGWSGQNSSSGIIRGAPVSGASRCRTSAAGSSGRERGGECRQPFPYSGGGDPAGGGVVRSIGHVTLSRNVSWRSGTARRIGRDPGKAFRAIFRLQRKLIAY